MNDKLLCFSLNGFTLAVEPDKVEKILINKHPTKDSFTLETGVEVKSLKSYIPLPAKEEVQAGNILFIKEQKDFYGFTVDRIDGYLKLKGIEKIGPGKENAPIQFFVRNKGRLIPVLDLQYVTNNENSVSREDIEEIVSTASEGKVEVSDEESKAVFEDVSEEEVYRAIDEEINKNKSLQFTEGVISSEKRGLTLPLIVNIAIVVVFSAGFLYYLMTTRERIKEQEVGGTISGVEEEVIREIRRKSEQEVEEQKKKLEEAKSRLEEIQKERDYFIQNQDAILKEREAELNEAYQKKLAEARERILASGAEDAEAEFEKERERLYQEFLSSRDTAREEIDKVKSEYEEALRSKENEIKREVDAYSKKIGEMEQKLIEEQEKLKETEQRFQSSMLKQQEYMTFRKQLNTIYNRALNQFARKNYDQGMTDLNTILPIIEKAKSSGIGDEVGLRVEENLVNNILYLAEKEKNRIDLNQIGQKTFEAASELEREEKLEEALSRYYTVYTIVDDNRLKSRAYSKAEAIMEEIQDERTEREKQEMEERASLVFNRAMEYKNLKRYDDALKSFEELITDYAGTSKSKQSLDEIILINKLKAREEEKEEVAGIDQSAFEIMKSAKNSYESGYYAEAIDKYQEVVTKYRNSNYAEEALNEILSINEEMREFKASPSISLKGQESNTGVIIQALSENTFLFSLGREDNVKAGEVLQLYRREGDELVFIGSLKVQEVYPTISRGLIVYYERKPKTGDIVSF